MPKVSKNVGLEEIKALTKKLQNERQVHLAEAARLSASLQSIRDELSRLLSSSDVAETPVIPDSPSKPKKAKKAKTEKADRIGNTRSRNGNMSGTQKIVDILMKNNKNMEAKALREEASKQGVKNPHSALQSLTRSETVKINDGQVSLQA